MNRALVALTALSISGILTARAARADLVTCRTGTNCLNGSDSIDWSQAGGPFDVIPGGAKMLSANGLAVTVDLPGNAWTSMTQGSGFYGNFSPGDSLLWTAGNGPVTLAFSTPVSGLGANIQSDDYGAFTALLQGFDAAGDLIDSRSIAGISNDHNDGSAVFLGLANDPGLVSATFSLTSSAGDINDFVINRVDIASVAPAPEPPSYLPLEAGVLVAVAIVVVRRKRVRTS